MARSPDGESVITRAVRILDAFGPESTVLSLSEVSRRARLPLATTARLVKEMARHGLLDRDERRQVLIGTRMWELAERASPVKDLREAALQYMGDLHSVVGHSTQLGVLEGDEALFVERLTAPGSVVNVTRIAGRLPLNASSAGLVLLAHAPDELRERVLRGPLASYTPHTLSEEQVLRAELAEVRRRGFAFCPGHIHSDATGIAVPVRRDGRVVAAMGLVVPNDDTAWTFSRPLMLAGLSLSRALSGTGPTQAPARAAGG
ncbi:IclR family transcriptional regulator [Nocardiopsis sp. TSRI0078]|uniref:IclR family transcriptional regulator n=1 Tax=unclassified Nocardiopsis TaxID=2649073 RepID=UPI00093E0FDD|nr:IclR family transcriptional regulator [Nocardiopsis sp. TSRI0078]OKI15752.1 IclR family transcriptional regulator [Nocardiopsis sp. TSRI0078]